ncbi:Protease prsW family protein [uncultured archaeon]|nr:Protease prsW family protein [uncultured archaeon]
MTTARDNRTRDRLILLFAILLAGTLATAVLAQSPSQEIPASSIRGTLDIGISPTAIVCTETPCVKDFSLNVTNNDQKQIEVYLYERIGDNYSLIATIGNVSKGEKAQFTFPFSLAYNGLTTYVGKYAIVSDGLKAKEFTVAEDWQKYESMSRDLLGLGGYIVAPIIAIAIIAILSIVVRSAERRRYGTPDEYTDTSLFRLPEGGSIGEQLATLLINPLTWGVIMFFAMLLLCMLAFSAYPNYPILTTIQIVAISLVAAAVFPIILLTLTWYADIVDREPFRFIVGMFMWGVLAAFIAFFINSALLYLFGKGAGMLPLVLTSVIGSMIISPVVEEIIKAFGLTFISLHHEFDDALDGLLYGFAIGIGFAMMENWFYFIARVDPIMVGIDAWVSVILYRSLFNTIAHGCFTGLAGVLLGVLKSRDRFKQYYHIALLPGIFIAILLHIAFNFTAYLDVVAMSDFRTILVSFNPALVIAIAFAFVLAYSAAVWDSRTQKKPRFR